MGVFTKLDFKKITPKRLIESLGGRKLLFLQTCDHSNGGLASFAHEYFDLEVEQFVRNLIRLTRTHTLKAVGKEHLQI